MSLVPSNMIAEQTNPGKTVFPNLARRVNEYTPSGVALEIFKEVDTVIRLELTEAGVLNPDGKGDPGNYAEYDWNRKINDQYKEVPTAIFAAKHRWKFERRWYYYAVSGMGIPPEFAVPFDKEWGTQVRVNGDCVCRGAEFWGEGFAIDSYHIDTQEGLNAFVELLASIHKPWDPSLKYVRPDPA